jgi:photosystem II stability/assembly factor-like uncharacterized protein
MALGTPASQAQAIEGGWRSQGPPGSVGVVIIDPFDPETVYSTVYADDPVGGSVFKTTDNGKSWLNVGEAPPLFVLWPLAADPFRPGTIFAVTNSASPHTANIYTTRDGALTWSLVASLPSSVVAVLLADPNYPDTLHAGGWRYTGEDSNPPALWKSRDSGETWVRQGSGLTGEIQGLAAAPSGSPLYAGTSDGFFRSEDGGRTWVSFRTGLSCHPITSIAVNPSRPNILFAGTYEHAYSFFDCRGVYKSTNQGASWELTSLHGIAYSFAFDPIRPDTIYAAAAAPSYSTPRPRISRSTDGGSTWQPFDQGLPEVSVVRPVVRLAINRDGTLLHAATEDGVFTRDLVTARLPRPPARSQERTTRFLPARP